MLQQAIGDRTQFNALNEADRQKAFDQYVQSGRINDQQLINAQLVSGAQIQSAANGIAQDALKNYQLPPGQAKPLTFQQYQVLQQYRPEVATFIQEKAPELITEQQSGAAKQAQNQDLGLLQQRAQTGEDAQSRAQAAGLMSQLQGQNDRSRADTMRAYSQRGLGGGSQDILANVAAGEANQGQARQQALDIAAQNDQRKMQALQIASNLAGVIRNQNLGVEQANKTTINDYNTRNTMSKRAYDESVVNAQNQAQLINQQNAQQTANANTGLSNQYGLLNTQRQEQAQADLRNAQNAKSGLDTQLRYQNLGIQQQNASQALALKAAAGQSDAQRVFNAAQDKNSTREHDFSALQGLSYGGANQQADLGNAASEASTGRLSGIINSGVSGAATAYGAYQTDTKNAQQDAANKAEFGDDYLKYKNEG